MSVIFPGAIIGGAPLEASSFTWRAVGGGATTTTDSFSMACGDAALGRNTKYGIGILNVDGGSAPNVSIVSASFGGVAASVIYTVTVTTATSLQSQFIVFTADISSLSGTITVEYTKNKSYFTRAFNFVTAVNLDASTYVTAAADGGGGATSVAASCNAGGGILGVGAYGYSGGGTPTTADFNNLTTLNWFDSIIGWSVGGEVFGSGQAGLDVSFDPDPNSAQCSSIGISFDPLP